jgi:NTE family protein
MGVSSSTCVNTITNKNQENIKLIQENDKLRELLIKQDSINREQFYMINLLKNEKFIDNICINNNNKNNNNSKEVNINPKELASQAKQNLDYDSLVFSGGGIKGLSFCGSVQILQELNILKNIKNFAGASVGSIIAALLAVGYTSEELKNIIDSLDYNKIVDDKIGYIRDAINLIWDFGIAPGDYIYILLGKLIEAKTGDPDYTIKQLYTNKNINLVIVATNMNTEQSKYFYHYSPNILDANIPIRKAVRASMSIPFVFEPVKHDGDLLVDGGVLDNLPLHVFDGDYPGDIKARLHMCLPNYKVLAINIMNDTELESYSLIKRNDIKTTVQFSICFLSSFLAENERRLMVPSYWVRTINILTPSYTLTNFDITGEQRQELYNLGKRYVREFFSKDGLVKIDL